MCFSRLALFPPFFFSFLLNSLFPPHFSSRYIFHAPSHRSFFPLISAYIHPSVLPTNVFQFTYFLPFFHFPSNLNPSLSFPPTHLFPRHIFSLQPVQSGDLEVQLSGEEELALRPQEEQEELDKERRAQRETSFRLTQVSLKHWN